MKQCPRCGVLLPDQEPFCQNCGFGFSQAVPSPQEGVPANPAPPMPPAAPPALAPRWVSGLPQGALPRQRPFSWADICTVLGFTSSVIGYFWASILLLPLGFITSLLGFRGDRTKGLAVAGIVISTIGLLLKLMAMLDSASLLPYWITNGIW